jgi:hypothetical protein
MTSDKTKNAFQAEHAVLDLRKLTDYCLNPAHPRGRHKARIFRDVLGFGQKDADSLRAALLDAIRSGAPSQETADVWGTRWRLDVNMARRGRTAVVRTIWIVRPGETVPRFVTCWVLR